MTEAGGEGEGVDEGVCEGGGDGLEMVLCVGVR